MPRTTQVLAVERRWDPVDGSYWWNLSVVEADGQLHLVTIVQERPDTDWRTALVASIEDLVAS